jgi:hypothetical protein
VLARGCVVLVRECWREKRHPAEAKQARNGYVLPMMMPYRRDNSAALRSAARRRRENEAPRLYRQVPDLAGLQLDLEEQVGIGSTKYIRRVVIEHSPALFLVPCGDPRCDGGHDLTASVMAALYGRETAFGGSEECRGSVGTTACHRILYFEATAEYARDDAKRAPL